ncbi:GTP-binding protein [Pseudarthrobacter sp. J75]|uniref:GTP-binding protein n=1 Tax=unclassified Pseudarthrobacter TaxID=2647000 RepID=UPI002E81E1BC|nr:MULTISPECIES: GTP-binding protein [unclassified Pseudarthrobacter]MEE2521221.1 GTP-binding protein [Pseudarthrobacter sp. J47]MEE2528453.1 GTP-binding protein [Pseudarthrobacter sp. J75]
MHLSLVSSLDSQCRQEATARLAGSHPDSVVVHHDLLEGSVVLRRIFRDGQLVERAENTLEHGCLSCTVRLDVIPTVQRLLDSGSSNVVLGLPPGVPTGQVAAGIAAGLGRQVKVENAVLALDPVELEDQIWDRHSLFESGFTSTPEDGRTSGEFLVGEFAHVDTVLTHHGLGASLAGLLRGDGADTTGWSAGVDLLSQLAPHAAVVGGEDEFRPNCYDPREAAARSRPGDVRVPLRTQAGDFRTVTHAVGRPLHPKRFQEALPQLAAGSHWLRGRLWMASAPTERIGLTGVGPLIWLENTGHWSAGDASDADALQGWRPDFGHRSTVVAVTGRKEDVQAREVRDLLDGCQLTPKEMKRKMEGQR